MDNYTDRDLPRPVRLDGERASSDYSHAVRLFERNKMLAVTFASRAVARLPKSVRRTLSDNDDVLTAAYLGLWEACQRFDPSRGFAFSTYATAWIRGKILHLLFPKRLLCSERLAACSLSDTIPGAGEMTVADTVRDTNTRRSDPTGSTAVSRGNARSVGAVGEKITLDKETDSAQWVRTWNLFSGRKN